MAGIGYGEIAISSEKSRRQKKEVRGKKEARKPAEGEMLGSRRIHAP